MLIVRVELRSAITGRITELARMEIANDGMSDIPTRGNYVVRTLNGRSTTALDKGLTQRASVIENWPRLSKHVWNLVSASLTKLGYG